MRDFFRGWKRKLGFLTLAIACLFAGGWVRSFRFEDHFDVFAGKYSTGPKRYFSLWSGVSANGTLFIGKIWGQPEDAKEVMTVESYYWYPRWHTSTEVDFPSDELRYLWRFCGLGFYERGLDDPHNGGWRVVIPYWSVVMPPTALSVWLLLPRAREKHARPE